MRRAAESKDPYSLRSVRTIKRHFNHAHQVYTIAPEARMKAAPQPSAGGAIENSPALQRRVTVGYMSKSRRDG